MRRLLLATVLAAVTAASPGVLAAPKTITLSVPGMDCPVCPLTIKKALSRVNGVGKVEVSFEKREAVVTFDDATTTVDALIDATTNAGYPSNAKQ